MNRATINSLVPIFEIAYWLGYAGPLLAFAVASPNLMGRRGWRATAAAVVGFAIVGAVILGIAGGLHRRTYHAGNFSGFGTMLAFAALVLLQLTTAVAVQIARRYDASYRGQMATALGTALTATVLAAIPFGISIGCMVSAECL